MADKSRSHSLRERPTIMKTLSSRFVSFALFLTILFGLSACNSPYKIVEPTDGALYTSAPAVFKISYDAAPATPPSITLNGIVVNSFFTFGPTEAVAQGSDLALYLVEGKNTFQIDASTFGPKVSFTYDTKGPEVLVLNADMQNPNTINGLLIDTAGAKSMFVNGVSATIAANGSFTSQVPLADIYTFDLVDKLDHVSQTKYSRFGLTDSNPILGMRIKQSGLDFAMGAVVNILNGLDFNALIGGTPIYDTTWKGPSGETYGADGFIDDLDLSTQNFGMTLGENGDSSFSGHIINVHAVLRLRLHNGLLPPTVITIGANIGSIDLSGNMKMSVVNNVPMITMSNFGLNIGQITLDNTPAIFNAIISPVTAGLTNFIMTAFSGIISKTLNTALSSIISQLILDSYQISMYGRDMSAVLKLEQLTTGSGSLVMTMSGGVAPVANSVDPLVAKQLGALYTADVLPDPSVTTGDFSMDINTNFINQIFASAHAVGLTQVNTVSAAGTNVKTNQFGLPHDDSIGADGDTRTLIEMQSAPQLTVSKSGNLPVTKIYMYGLTMKGQKKVNGVWANVYRASMNVTADVKLSVGADNLLQFTVASVPNINITSIAVGDGPDLPGAVNDLVNGFVQGGIGFVLEQLTAPLTNLKLPSLMCMSMTFDKIKSVGNNDTHLDLAGTFLKTSNTCDNPLGTPPKVAYGRMGSAMGCASNEEYDAGLCYQPCPENYDGVGPVCWARDASVGRGVGTIPTSACASNQDSDAGLCYPKCQSGFHGVGPVCWNDQAASYGRGVGTIPNLIPYACPNGKQMDAGLCYPVCNSGYHGVGPVCWLDTGSYGRGVGTVPPQSCASGQEMDAGLCYPVCASGYHGVGPVCWTNSALSIGRGVGAPVHTCPAGKDKDAGLCYEQCSPGYNGSGPTCWPQQ